MLGATATRSQDCVRCGLPFRTDRPVAGHELLCSGCHTQWVTAGRPDELPPLHPLELKFLKRKD